MKNKMKKQRVGAVIVTYNPEPKVLQNLVKKIEKSVEKIFLVDNGSKDFNAKTKFGLKSKKANFIVLGDNKGIAYAQNRGIEAVQKLGYEFVILFDHDSDPDVKMIEVLKAVAQEKINQGVKFACVGPRYLDPRQNNPPPFLQIRGLKLYRHQCSDEKEAVAVDYLIASGCLINTSILAEVGLMQESLFIDYVDIEWGLRAKVKGYQSFGCCLAKMNHNLGDSPVKFGKRSIAIHSPLRHYYHFRNAIWLYKQGWVPLNWKLVDLWRMVLKIGFYTLYAPSRWQQLRYILTGIKDGLISKMGKKTL